jgi:aspartyl-tRNA(Asn)/glutamyl-tRNA(Gln) amidotransferase subunit B
VEAVRKKLPELPEARRDRFVAEYGLTFDDANELTKSKAMADYFEDITKSNKNVSPKEVSNWLLGEANRIMNVHNIDIDAFRKRVGPETLPPLIVSARSTINIGMAKSVFEEMYNTGKDSEVIIKERGLSQISDTQELENIVAEVINSNMQPVADYRSGKETALKFLVGQVMKATRGRANPQLVNEVLKRKLAET